MDKICGNCHYYANSLMHGPWCTKKRKEVSYLHSAFDCWTEPGTAPTDDIQMKVCSHCGRELPITNFGRHSRTKDGYQPCCRECQSEMNKGHRPRHAWKKADSALEDGKPKRRGRVSAHPDCVDEKTGQEMHWCGKCKQYKPTDRFNKNRASASGLESYCKECSVAHERERRARKRAEKKASEATIEAVAQVAEKVAHEYVMAQPKVDAPAGGIVLPEQIEKTVPKVVVCRELKLTKSVTVEANLYMMGMDDDGIGRFELWATREEMEKVALAWNKNPLTVTLAFDEIKEG